MVFFSPSTRGFYMAEIHGEDMPADVVRISAARHAQLLVAQAAGAEIVPGHNGAPIIMQPKPTLAGARCAAAAAVRREARRRILAIAPYWRQFNDLNAIAMAALQPEHIGCVALEAALGRRRAIDKARAASDRLEARVAAMPAAELAGFDPGDDTHWSDAA
jgi:hypothetical protein